MMLKKVGIIVFSLIFAFSFSCYSVSADTVQSDGIDTLTPALSDAENNQLNGARYLVEYLRQGGRIDLSSTSDGYTAIDLLDDVADFFNGTIAQLCGDSGYWINNISDTQTPEYIYLEEPVITKLVNFGLDALADLTTTEVQPQPDPDYLSYIEFINGNRFNITNYTFVPDLNYSTTNIACGVSQGTVNSNKDFNSSTVSIVRFPYMSVYINGSDETQWLVTHTEYNNNESIITTGWNQYNLYSMNFSSKTNDVWTNFNGAWTQNYVSGNFNFLNGSFSSLDSAFNHVKRYYNKVNIFVNGDPWAIVSGHSYHIGLSQGTFIDGTNTPVKYDLPDNTKIDLTDLIDRLDTLIENQNKISFPDISNLIVDENGQQALAVYVINRDLSVDDQYVTDYGTLVPVFPVFVSLPHVEDTVKIATVGIVDVIPGDIMEVLGIALVGMLFVTWIHRLLE